MIVSSSKRPSNIVAYMIIVFLVYVNVVNIVNVGLFSLTGSSFFVNYAPATKDLLLYSFVFMMLCYVLLYTKLSISTFRLLLLTLLLLGFISLSFLISHANISYKVFNLRRIFTEYVVILTFALLPLSSLAYSKIVKSIVYIGVGISFFGFFELILPNYFWDTVMQLPSYYNASNFTNSNYEKIIDMGGQAYTSDLWFLTGDKTRRMISTYVEATTLGSFFTFLFTYVYFSNIVKYKKTFLWIFLIAGFLVFSKAFILSLFIVIMYSILKRPVIYPVFAISGLLLFFGFYIHSVLGKVHGSFSHFIGLYTGVKVAFEKPFGYGIGVAGNRGEFSVASVNGVNGGESGLGNVLAQIGVAGYLSVVILFYVLWEFKKYYYLTGNREYFAIFVATVNWYVIYLLSASSLGFSGNIIFFVFIGLMLNRTILKERVYAKTI